jgi:hypothetical protein
LIFFLTWAAHISAGPLAKEVQHVNDGVESTALFKVEKRERGMENDFKLREKKRRGDGEWFLDQINIRRVIQNSI